MNNAKRFSKEVDLTFCHLRRYEHLLKSKIFSVNNNAIETTPCLVNSLQVVSWYEFKNNDNKNNEHCVKVVQIRSFSGPYFPAFGLNTEIYGVNRDQKNSVFGHFSRSGIVSNKQKKHVNSF